MTKPKIARSRTRNHRSTSPAESGSTRGKQSAKDRSAAGPAQAAPVAPPTPSQGDDPDNGAAFIARKAESARDWLLDAAKYIPMCSDAPEGVLFALSDLREILLHLDLGGYSSRRSERGEVKS